MSKSCVLHRYTRLLFTPTDAGRHSGKTRYTPLEAGTSHHFINSFCDKNNTNDILHGVCFSVVGQKINKVTHENNNDQ